MGRLAAVLLPWAALTGAVAMADSVMAGALTAPYIIGSCVFWGLMFAPLLVSPTGEGR